MSIFIAPSILAADFSRMGEEVRHLTEAGADLIHVDVMDGHFVPNLTMGPDMVKAIRPHTKLPLDCHLMVEFPQSFLKSFREAGADWISVHVEACELEKVLPEIKALGCKAGAVLNPGTHVHRLLPFAHLADYILVMSVNPGFTGQSLLPKCLEKVQQLAEYRQQHKLTFQIQIDGCVNLKNIAEVKKAGADIAVVGSGLLSSKDYAKTMLLLRGA